MSTFETAQQPYGMAARVAAILPVTAAILRSVFARFDTVRRARRTARTLNGLSDRELRDIGLTRSDIGRLARSSARQEFSAGRVRPSA